MARMSDFHVVGDPRFAPDVPSGGGGVSQEYVDNADIEVKKTTAKGHNTKYDESVIPSQYTNKLYVYGNPESMYPASDIGGEIPAITGGHVSVSYNWWGQQKEGWEQYDFKPYGYDSETDMTFDKLCVVKCVYQADIRNAFYIFLCTCAGQYITVIPDRTEPAHTIMYSGIANKLYAQRYSGDPPTPQGYNLETNLGYYTNGIIADFNYENNQYYDFEVSGIPLFVVNSNTQSEFDDVNYYIATGDYSGAVNYSELYPDNPESYVAIDVISGDWYKVVNGAWVKQGTLELNGASGGGGNSITYGTDAPTGVGADGDLYFLLSGGKKVAEFLYMSNAWVLIDGSYDSMSVLVLESQRNSGASNSYTATEECVVLCLNQNMNNEASNKSLTASINTTGTVLYTDQYTAQWAYPDRNQVTRLSLVHLDAGESVTLSNEVEGSYTTQLHLVVKLNAGLTVNQITMMESNAKADNTYSTAQTYASQSSGLFFAYGFQTRGTGRGTTYATISTSGASEIKELLTGGANESLSIALFNHPNTATFSWGNQNDYATKGYAVYKLG